jgi:hypothetical protein
MSNDTRNTDVSNGNLRKKRCGGVEDPESGRGAEVSNNNISVSQDGGSGRGDNSVNSWEGGTNEDTILAGVGKERSTIFGSLGEVDVVGINGNSGVTEWNIESEFISGSNNFRAGNVDGPNREIVGNVDLISNIR